MVKSTTAEDGCQNLKTNTHDKETSLCQSKIYKRTVAQEEAGTDPCNAARSSVGDAALLLDAYVSDALSAQTAQVHRHRYTHM